MAGMSPINCVICNSANVGHPRTVPDNEYGLPFKNTYYKCNNCDCFFQVPMPDLKTLASYYPVNYHSMDSNSLISKLKNGSRWKRLRNLLKDKKKFTLLDYGCGDGGFLSFIAEKEKSAQLYGYEIGGKDEVIKIADNITIYRGNIDFMLRSIPNCNMVTMNHVIEHLPDPYTTIKNLANKLEPRGIIEGQTPNTECIERMIFGLRWSGYHAPRHTVIFSKKAINILFTQISLSDIRVNGAFNPAGYAVSFASLFNSSEGGTIVRKGLKWMFFVGLATAFYPLDMLKPGIIDFSAQRNNG